MIDFLKPDKHTVPSAPSKMWLPLMALTRDKMDRFVTPTTQTNFILNGFHPSQQTKRKRRIYYSFEWLRTQWKNVQASWTMRELKAPSANWFLVWIWLLEQVVKKLQQRNCWILLTLSWSQNFLLKRIKYTCGWYPSCEDTLNLAGPHRELQQQ